jgi:DNA-binding response OmpR family regulator
MNKVLLIVPDVGLREQLTFMLEHSGLKVAVASMDRSALPNVGRTRPDLIVMAESAHRFNGDEPCIRIREIYQNPIIILGRHQEQAAGIHLLEMCADAYLTPPLDPRELLARIRSLLRRTGRQFQRV